MISIPARWNVGMMEKIKYYFESTRLPSFHYSQLQAMQTKSLDKRLVNVITLRNLNKKTDFEFGSS